MTATIVATMTTTVEVNTEEEANGEADVTKTTTKMSVIEETMAAMDAQVIRMTIATKMREAMAARDVMIDMSPMRTTTNTTSAGIVTTTIGMTTMAETRIVMTRTNTMSGNNRVAMEDVTPGMKVVAEMVDATKEAKNGTGGVATVAEDLLRCRAKK
jgi:hypothetical protein